MVLQKFPIETVSDIADVTVMRQSVPDRYGSPNRFQFTENDVDAADYCRP